MVEQIQDEHHTGMELQAAGTGSNDMVVHEATAAHEEDRSITPPMLETKAKSTETPTTSGYEGEGPTPTRSAKGKKRAKMLTPELIEARKSAISSHESYEERKIQLARSGQLVPAIKNSSMKAEGLTRLDRDGNEIGVDRKKFHITYIDNCTEKPLAQVHCVESYKRYNQEDPSQGENPCCTIF